ncbi:hypothetical protein [Paenibacillus bovis]|uniref:Uncharacterized protein n=1 Tax=Paenibacillus bovis TaxID=1616788 RepID=A0A172ZI78_9BACL|nr:hypothetical protein [Paenibacillus bovis]ANF96997.1 hypothetical protein AR543_13940 [Paenibacillus bovis]
MRASRILKKAAQFARKPVVQVTGAVALIAICFLAPADMISAPEGSAYFAEKTADSTSEDDSNIIQIPTDPPTIVSQLPEAEDPAGVSYVTGDMVSNEPGGRLPISIAVERQVSDSAWLKDKLTIGPKEAALTADMLRKDGGTIGIFGMPPAEKKQVGDLYFVFRQRAAELFSVSHQGVFIYALYGQLMLPPDTVSTLIGDLNIHLHTDHGAAKPDGAQGTPMEFINDFPQGGIWLNLPVENRDIDENDLTRLKIHATYPNGQKEYLSAELTHYDDEYPYGMKFEAKQNAIYTVVLPGI